MKLSIKTVDNLQEALDHIDHYSSRHSEAIIAEDQETIAAQFKPYDHQEERCWFEGEPRSRASGAGLGCDQFIMEQEAIPGLVDVHRRLGPGGQPYRRVCAC